jgi:mannose-6-phosphate isomerase-like protein (cupin superfamily)
MLVCRKNGARHIAQRVSEYALGCSPAVVNPQAEEVLYVVSGRGTCRVNGFPYDLESRSGIFIPGGAAYSWENLGPENLVLVGVCCPEDDQRHIVENAQPANPQHSALSPPNLVVREQDREPMRAGKDRKFWLLVDQDRGCRQITQFVGFVPPSKAQFHYHTYEEAIYILEGAGIVHTGNAHCEYGPGTCIFLPVGVRHCLENPGPGPVRLLGVFYPSGSPAAAYEK